MRKNLLALVAALCLCAPVSAGIIINPSDEPCTENCPDEPTPPNFVVIFINGVPVVVFIP
jgi:hypothetical protein